MKNFKLKNLMMEYEIENLVFIVDMRPIHRVPGIPGIGFTSSDDEYVKIPCKINEERYKLADNYKITMESMYKGFGKTHFYISDFENIVNQGNIKIYVEVKEKNHELSF